MRFLRPTRHGNAPVWIGEHAVVETGFFAQHFTIEAKSLERAQVAQHQRSKDPAFFFGGQLGVQGRVSGVCRHGSADGCRVSSSLKGANTNGQKIP